MRAVNARDYPLVLGVIMVTAAHGADQQSARRSLLCGRRPADSASGNRAPLSMTQREIAGRTFAAASSQRRACAGNAVCCDAFRPAPPGGIRGWSSSRIARGRWRSSRRSSPRTIPTRSISSPPPRPPSLGPLARHRRHRPRRLQPARLRHACFPFGRAGGGDDLRPHRHGSRRDLRLFRRVRSIRLIQRFTDAVMCFPSLIIIIAAVAIIGPSIYNVMIVIGCSPGQASAGSCAGDFLSLREREFVEAARADGAANTTAHLPPPPAQRPRAGHRRRDLRRRRRDPDRSGLSFLGLGVQPPTPSWGNMINTAQSAAVLQQMPWLWIPAGF